MRDGAAHVRSGALLLAAGLAAGACTAGPRARAETGVPSPAPTVKAQAPQPPPEPVTPPDRSQPPWSRTGVPLLAIGEVERGTFAGGTTWRIGTRRGAVLVYRPAGYRPHRAGLAVYLHGYFTTVDQAAADHQLLEQFRKSGRDALFVAPEAPAWNGEESVWTELAPLVQEVLHRTGVTPPAGPVVVAAHSGGYRTMMLWLGEPRVQELVLLDGFYRGEAELRAWLESGPAASKRRLVLLGAETAAPMEALAAQVPGALLLPRLPPPATGLDARAREARLLCIRSQQGHMAIVERGEALPLLLAGGRLPALR